MKTGTLQRRWSQTAPMAYNKETRTVCMDIRPEKGRGMLEGDELTDGFSYYEINIDSHIDYGHIKSQLIEQAFPQKDEFGLLMNAVSKVIEALTILADDNDAIRDILSTDDISTFVDFCEYRDMCADAAKRVVKEYEL